MCMLLFILGENVLQIGIRYIFWLWYETAFAFFLNTGICYFSKFYNNLFFFFCSEYQWQTQVKDSVRTSVVVTSSWVRPAYLITRNPTTFLIGLPWAFFALCGHLGLFLASTWSQEQIGRWIPFIFPNLQIFLKFWWPDHHWQVYFKHLAVESLYLLWKLEPPESSPECGTYEQNNEWIEPSSCLRMKSFPSYTSLALWGHLSGKSSTSSDSLGPLTGPPWYVRKAGGHLE